MRIQNEPSHRDVFQNQNHIVPSFQICDKIPVPWFNYAIFIFYIPYIIRSHRVDWWRMKTTQFSSGRHLGNQWTLSGTYFEGTLLVVDNAVRSVLWTYNSQWVEQYARHILLKYSPCLPINWGESVPKSRAPTILDEWHCSRLHPSTQCEICVID